MMPFILHVTCLCISHAYILSFQYTCYIWNVLGLFWLSLSLPLFSFTLVLSMAPKWKSSLSGNPFHSGASTSSNPTPSHIRFRDEDACKAFSENFSQWGIHSKHRVILADFVDTNLPDVIHSWGWELLCDVLVTCPSMLIQEFYSNIHGFDFSVPFFHICIRGMRIAVTPQLVVNVLRVPGVEFPNYHGCELLRTVSKDELKSTFCKHLSDWGECQFT